MRRGSRLPIALALTLSVASTASADVQELVGRPAPPVRARPLDAGGEIDFAAYRGRVVLVAFVATWCGACRRLGPELEALRERYADRGLEVLAFSHEGRGRIRRHLDRAEPGVPWLQCTGRTAVQWEADALPTVVLVGRDGTVEAAFQGVQPDTVASLRRAVAEAVE